MVQEQRYGGRELKSLLHRLGWLVSCAIATVDISFDLVESHRQGVASMSCLFFFILPLLSLGGGGPLRAPILDTQNVLEFLMQRLR